jgi:hypothetical protein
MKSILYLIESRNPPVFETPIVIEHNDSPKVGEAFLFECHMSKYCNVSTIKSIEQRKGHVIVTTRNSIYALYPLPTEAQ